MDRDRILKTVRQALSESLEIDLERITIESTLIDDLGAESIDFLDFSYRMEKAFGIQIADEELFQGQFDVKDAGLIAAGRVTELGISRLRGMLPEFDFDRFDDGVIYLSDLPRLMTVRTLVEYFEKRFRDGSPS